MHQVQPNVFDPAMTFSSWTKRARRALASARLRRIESKRLRMQAQPAPVERGAALARARELETLCVDEARLSNLVGELSIGNVKNVLSKRTSSTS